MIEKLDIVNACLATMGEAPLETLEDEHSYLPAALVNIDASHQFVSSRRLWFNTEVLKLVPEVPSKYVMVPQDVIAVDARSKCGRYLVSQRGTRLYNVTDSKYEFDSYVEVEVRRHLQYDLLPYEAQAFIRDDAVLKFQSDFDGDRTKYERLSQDRILSYNALMAEHVRQMKYNLLGSSIARMAVGPRYAGPYHPHRTFPG